MSTVEIQIKAVYPAKQGKKFGAIQAMDGTRYMLPKDAPCNHIQNGMQAVIEYHNEDWKDGTVFIIDNIRSAEQRPNHPQGTPAFDYATAEAAKSRQIFIQGVAQAALHGMSWANDMSVHEAVMSAVEASRDAYEAIIMEKRQEAPKRAAPEQDLIVGGLSIPNDDPRFSAPPPSGPDDYGAQR